MRRSAGLVVLAIVLGAAPSHAWLTAVTGTPPEGRPTAIAVDADGTVVAVGRTPTAAGKEDAIAVALGGADGAELWQHVVGGGAALDDLYRAVTAVNGVVVAAGRVSNPKHEGDALITRFGPGGVPVWEVQIDSAAHLEEDAFAVTVDADGDVVAGGESTTPEGHVTEQFTVWKRSGADGTELWTSVIQSAGVGTVRAVAMAGTDVIAAGTIGRTMTIAAFDGDTGGLLWQRIVQPADSNNNDAANSVAVAGGRVFVGGQLVDSHGELDFVVMALDVVTGAELWRTTIDGTMTGADVDETAFKLAVDAGGNVIAVGQLSNAAGDDAIAVKLKPTSGSELWRTVVNGPNSNKDVFQDMALDPAGNVLVTGTLRNNATRADFLISKLSNATGAEMWRILLDGTEHMPDTGTAIATAPNGDPVATGRLRNGTGDGFVVTRRTALSGGSFPCGDGVKIPGELCDDGNGAIGDGCRPDCTPEVCGDGIKDPQEACDGGFGIASDCCSDSCHVMPDGAGCSDGDACTASDSCVAGVCTPGARVTCTPLSPCHLALCDSATGACSSPPKAEGAPCSDGNACTVLDQCLAGACTGRQTLVCNDGNPCTSDACTPAFGCTFEQVTGIESIACTFRRGRIDAACGTDLPRPIAQKMRKAKALIEKASLSQKPAKVRRSVKIAMRNLQKALRIALARADKDQLDGGCAGALESEIDDITARAQAVLAELGS